MTRVKTSPAMQTAAFALGLALAAGITGAARAETPIRIGILTELSGPLGPSGSGERDGFLLYLKTHDNKLGGRAVETVIEDTANDPQTTISKAKKLIESDKIDVLVGPLSSANAAALKSYVVASRMPSFIEATVDEDGDGKYIFRTSFSNNADSFLQGYLPGKAGFRKAVAIAPNFNAGQGAVEYFEKGFAAAGGTVIQKILPRLGQPDFGSVIAQFSPEADVGIVFEAGGDAVRFVKQYAEFGKKLPLYGYTATVDETLLPAEGDAAVGFVGAAFYFSTLDTKENKEFVADYRAAYSMNPAWFSAGGYIAGAALDQALQKLGGKVADREALVGAIKAVSFVSPAGSFHFDADNNPVQPRYIAQIRAVDGVVQPVVLGSIPAFNPVPEPPLLPAGLVLPR